MDGTNASTASKFKSAISKAAAAVSQEAVKDKMKGLPIKVAVTEPDINAEYIYGSEVNSLFDNFGAPLTGIIIFFSVFLIAGINFLNERKSGTLEKLLSTPIRRGGIIGGYVLGFGILAGITIHSYCHFATDFPLRVI